MVDLWELGANSSFTGSSGQPEHHKQQLQPALQHLRAVHQATPDPCYTTPGTHQCLYHLQLHLHMHSIRILLQHSNAFPCGN